MNLEARPTPETDAQRFDATPESENLEPLMDVVSYNFARDIERQRDTYRDALKQIAAEGAGNSVWAETKAAKIARETLAKFK